LLVGKDVKAASIHASKIEDVSKVLILEDDKYLHLLAEDFSNLLSNVSKNFTHVLAPSTNNGKNFIPRTAALLDSSPLSEVLLVVDSETFKRPMYAGNAIATVKMTNSIKVSYCSHQNSCII
jgi:electron transfer flavoprotein alpha subunit